MTFSDCTKEFLSIRAFKFLIQICGTHAYVYTRGIYLDTLHTCHKEMIKNYTLWEILYETSLPAPGFEPTTFLCVFSRPGIFYLTLYLITFPLLVARGRWDLPCRGPRNRHRPHITNNTVGVYS